MQSGRETSRSLVEKYLARIASIDRGGPALRSVIETNPDALTIADQLDAERRAAVPRGPLHGIPILLKDNIATADRMMTTRRLAGAGRRHAAKGRVRRRRGSARLAQSSSGRRISASGRTSARPTRRAAGADAAGRRRTRMPSIATHRVRARGPAPPSPRISRAAAVGTETDGSIVSPSSSNSLVGIKPTLGLLSRSGIVPIAHSQDTAGPMARTVADAAVLLGGHGGADPDDPATSVPARAVRAPPTTRRHSMQTG